MKRYHMSWGYEEEVEDQVGDWCRYSDYADLEAQLHEAQAENADKERYTMELFNRAKSAEDLIAMLINFIPTPENVNALPEGIRRYVHDIETRCDPSGDIQTIACLHDTNQGLELWAKELQDENRQLEAENAALRADNAKHQEAVEYFVQRNLDLQKEIDAYRADQASMFESMQYIHQEYLDAGKNWTRNKDNVLINLQNIGNQSIIHIIGNKRSASLLQELEALRAVYKEAKAYRKAMEALEIAEIDKKLGLIDDDYYVYCAGDAAVKKTDLDDALAAAKGGS